MVTYRQASIADLNKIVSLENKCFSEADRFSRKNLLRMIQNPMKSILVDLIQFDETIVGYAVYLTRMTSKKIRLYSICIDPQYSGKGIGQQYLLMRLKEFPSYKEIYLELRESNLPALSLYKKLGFQFQKNLPSYYPDGENGIKLKLLINN